MNDCITTTKQSTTKPCAYFLGYTVYALSIWHYRFVLLLLFFFFPFFLFFCFFLLCQPRIQSFLYILFIEDWVTNVQLLRCRRIRTWVLFKIANGFLCYLSSKYMNASIFYRLGSLQFFIQTLCLYFASALSYMVKNNQIRQWFLFYHYID